MKKYLLNWMAIMVVAVVSVGFASCGDDDEEGSNTSIVGTWAWIERRGDHTLFRIMTIKSGGTYTAVGQGRDVSWEESGLWKV